ncbi:MAG: sulfatase [Bacteroidales bacterium]|nr:sulfatase [Bacteroidales bacterium]
MKNYILNLIPILFASSYVQANDPPPNIIWVIVEDMSLDFGYNGETLIQTPNLDQMASEGVVFERAYVTAPVCSASRSALITGMYQTSISAQNHRSSRNSDKIYLPEEIKTIPEYFREAGYYVSNQYIQRDNWSRPGKEDYNFVYKTEDLYSGVDWNGREEGQAFFAQIHMQGGKKRNVQLPEMVNPDNVVLPPHYPNDPVLRKDWAEYLNSVKEVDNEVRRIFDRLKAENLLENTLVFFITDHGISHARGKQFCYEEGAHIPMIVWGQKYVGQGIRKELVSHIDLAATSMYFAGIKIPDYMESKPLFGKDATPREFVITARDRCDETVDHIRSVRKGDYLYIKNYLYQRPLLQPNAYKDHKDILIRLRELHAQGKLNSLQERLLFSEQRPYEELYNIALDENQYVNLASDKNMKVQLEEMREVLNNWEIETNDQGRDIESPEVYESEMSSVIKSVKGSTRLPERANVLRENVELMKKWAAEGK